MAPGKILIAIAAVAILAAGCDSGSGSSGSTLNTTQMALLTQETNSAVSGGMAAGGAFTANDQMPGHHHPHPVGHDHPNATVVVQSTSVSCEAGGTSTVSGSMTYSASSSTVTISALTFSVSFNDCQHIGSDGVTYTITTPSGPITVDASGSFTSNAGEVNGNMTVTETGTIDVTGTNLSANCSIDVTASETTTNNVSSGTVTGTACGNSVNASF